ncbi:MAG: type II toxin-antitoxin system RelE/ParE family toxin [Spirulina sp.]
MKVEFRKTFEKDLRKASDKILFRKIKEVIESVERTERLDEISNLKKLKGGDNYFRIRVGDYRIGLFLEEDIVFFVRVMHRREFYRYFP